MKRSCFLKFLEKFPFPELILLGTFLCSCQKTYDESLWQKVSTYSFNSPYSIPSFTVAQSQQKFQQVEVLFEENPDISFSIQLPFHWESLPVRLNLPSSQSLNLVARFYKKQSGEVCPFTEILYFPLKKNLDPQDWLLWYAEQQSYRILQQQKEQINGREIAHLLFQQEHSPFSLIGQISAFQQGARLWIISLICLESDYLREVNAFAVMAGSFTPRSSTDFWPNEWLPISLPPFQIHYPNFFQQVEDPSRLGRWERREDRETWIGFSFGEDVGNLPLFLQEPEWKQQETKNQSFEGILIKRKHFTSSLAQKEYIVLEFETVPPYQFELYGPTRKAWPLLWMENKWTLEQMIRSLQKTPEKG